MIEQADCAKCKDNCCLRAQVNITVFDLAKIIHLLEKDLVFKESGRGFGTIYYNNKKLIVIKEKETPEVFIEPPCKLLNNELKCTLHERIIPTDSFLGKILKSNNQPLYAKPFTCGKHPYGYDIVTDSIKRLADCSDFDSELVSIDEDKDYIIEALTSAVYEQVILKYRWKQRGDYPIINTALGFLGKNSCQLSHKASNIHQKASYQP
ncbi:hypothetical protein GF352_00370 [archaeon]|nr:hypothetical protein [archaeon]